MYIQNLTAGPTHYFLMHNRRRLATLCPFAPLVPRLVGSTVQWQYFSGVKLFITHKEVLVLINNQFIEQFVAVAIPGWAHWK